MTRTLMSLGQLMAEVTENLDERTARSLQSFGCHWFSIPLGHFTLHPTSVYGVYSLLLKTTSKHPKFRSARKGDGHAKR